jgi:transposase
MQRALELMNVKLTYVISDITGVTGLSIIRAILAGVRDPRVLAKLRHVRCAKSEEQIAKAPQVNYRVEHLFVLRQALVQYDFYQRQLQECDAEMEAMYPALPPSDPHDQASAPPKPKTAKPRKNQAQDDLATSLYRMVGVDLTAVDGIHALTAQTIITEIGVDITPWPTAKHFASWLGLAPNN